MIRKKIATMITAATRVCSKCGKTVTISATEDKTICDCGEVVYDAKKDGKINGEITHEETE